MTRLKARTTGKILLIAGYIITVIGILWASNYIAGELIFHTTFTWGSIWMDDGFKYSILCIILGIVLFICGSILKTKPDA